MPPAVEVCGTLAHEVRPMSWKALIHRGSPLPFWGMVVLICSVPGALDSVLEFGSPEQVAAEKPSASSEAQAQSIWESDSDGDGFSDELEVIYGSNPFEVDTDRDGALDSFEFTHGTNLLDATSSPTMEPSIRVQAREDGPVIRVYIGIFPADLHLVDKLEVHLGGREMPLGEGDSTFRAFNFTPALTHAMTGISQGTQDGLSVVLVTLSIPSQLLDSMSAVAIAVVAKIAGQLSIHQVEITTLPSGARATTSQLLAGSNLAPGQSAFQLMPLDARYGGGEEPEYCELSVDSGRPLGLAGIQFLIEDAGCAPAGLTLCVSEECDSMIGQEILEVDRGFLQDRMD